MGVGKSSVGRELSTVLNTQFIDLDSYIEDKYAMSIKEIFNSKGEAAFREMEMQSVLAIIKLDQQIIALGGGSLEFNKLDSRIRSSALLIYLKASPEFLYERLKKEKAQRPLIANMDDEELLTFISQHLAKREKKYLNAQLSISVENKSTSKIVGFIKEYLDLV